MKSYKTFRNLLLKHPRNEVQSPNRAHADVFDKERVLTSGKTTAFLKSASVIKRPGSNSEEQGPALSRNDHTAQGYSLCFKIIPFALFQTLPACYENTINYRV